MSKNDKTSLNTLNTYLYCCKSLPRSVNQILHLPSSLRSKNSLHGLWWGGFWIATPLPATQTPPRHDITCTTSSPRRTSAKQGLRCQKEPGSLKNLQFQEEQKVCTYHYPTTIQGRLATYQTLRSSYSKVQAKKKK